MVTATQKANPVETRYWIRVGGSYLFGASNEGDYQFMQRRWTTWDAVQVAKLVPELQLAYSDVRIEPVEEETVLP